MLFYSIFKVIELSNFIIRKSEENTIILDKQNVLFAKVFFL